MHEERMQVLRMLAEGRVTPEQANELLDALGEAMPAPATSQRDWVRRSDQPVRGRSIGSTVKADKLVELQMYGVDKKFIEEMRAAGFEHLTLDELVELRMFGVTGGYVREMRALGYVDLPPEKYAELRSHGVTPETVRELETVIADVEGREEE